MNSNRTGTSHSLFPGRIRSTKICISAGTVIPGITRRSPPQTTAAITLFIPEIIGIIARNTLNGLPPLRNSGVFLNSRATPV